MKDFNKIVGFLWVIAAFIFWIQGVFGICIDENYIKPFLKCICCAVFAIYLMIRSKK